MNTLEEIEQYLQDHSAEWNGDKRGVFYLAIDNYLWQKTKKLISSFLLLPLHVKGEIMLYLACYPEHLYALSNDPQLSRPSLNGLWCEIYKKMYKKLPSFPRYTQLSMMSIYMNSALEHIYRQKRANALRAELMKVGCELREDSELCQKWIDNVFNKSEYYYRLENVVDTMFVVHILFSKYDMKTQLSKYYKSKYPKRPTDREKKIGFSIVKRQMLQAIPDGEIQMEKQRVLSEKRHLRDIRCVFAPNVGHIRNMFTGEFAQSAHYIIKIHELLEKEKYTDDDYHSDSDG